MSWSSPYPRAEVLEHVERGAPGPQVSRGLWFAILECTERERKAVIFAEALKAFRAALQITDPAATWVPGLLARYESTLKNLRGG